jgi:hypothetical protein
MFYFIRNVFSNHIVYDYNIIICRLVTKHESNNESTSTPNESPNHKRLINKVYVPPCSCCIRKNTTMAVYYSVGTRILIFFALDPKLVPKPEV